MYVYLNNKNFEAIDVIDYFSSMIWSDRFCDAGTFELYIGVSNAKAKQIIRDLYLSFDESEHGMIIEKKEVQSDPEQGSYWVITGRSFESILGRRIAWNSTVLSGNFQNEIHRLLNENLISPSDPKRKIENFIFKESSDPTITSLTIDDKYEYKGENVFDIVKQLCSDKKVGFKVTLNDSNQFVFALYPGTDRSYEQEVNDYVTFSPSFDNLSNSNYYESSEDYKNVILSIGTYGSDNTTSVSIGDFSGLDRREMYLETSINQDITDPTSYVRQKGNEELEKNKEKKVFDGEIDTTRMYKYNEDFFMGDIVQLEDEYGSSGRARMTEMTYSQDEQNGETRVPTFDTNI